MTAKQLHKRLAAVKTADAINAIEGAPVSDYGMKPFLYALRLSRSDL